jgi:signal transduction histidine kinase
MILKLKTKIWLTVLSIVLMFAFFTLVYFPEQQAKLLLKNYNTEVQNLANTVALGVKIAITEQNFEGVETALEFVKDDPRLHFISMLQNDTVWNSNHSRYEIKETIFKTFPENRNLNPYFASNDTLIVKRSPFKTSIMSGDILLGFTTRQIISSKKKIRDTSLIVSGIVLFIGVLLGFMLARNISVPVLALRNAAIRVGEGDLSQRVISHSKDEIGELGKAFNKMVDDLSRTRKELNQANITLSETNKALNSTLHELKSTQAQLIQNEKMASLGELTAGIAHEIQNPLNFVNNFSDVSGELLDELKEGPLRQLPDVYKPEAEEMLNNLSQNLLKINYHGKRADSIVKGMLQHSRPRNINREPVDLNVLADEYLRLSYHGLKAKDKSFNATIKTEFDESIGKINVIPQDIGRVLLNLLNNAFYSVMEKKAHSGEGFNPTVSISTKKMDHDNVKIVVWDNGLGIKHKILDKVFQPFFTTKPPGEGTGLGLSLSYEIITKGYGGELKVETKEGEFAQFTIHLPL